MISTTFGPKSRFLSKMSGLDDLNPFWPKKLILGDFSQKIKFFYLSLKNFITVILSHRSLPYLKCTDQAHQKSQSAPPPAAADASAFLKSGAQTQGVTGRA